jgi:hypothetical protein
VEVAIYNAAPEVATVVAESAARPAQQELVTLQTR